MVACLCVSFPSDPPIMSDFAQVRGEDADKHASLHPPDTTATASYRLLPTIHITKPIPSALCDKFAQCFAPGVVEVEKDEDGNKVCRVVNSRKDTVSREVLRHPEFEDFVILGRKRDHFICES